jgi:hypothetical protein
MKRPIHRKSQLEAFTDRGPMSVEE